MKKTIPSLFQYLRNDLLSSIVVFLIAIPLCLGIALASDVPPELGLLAGIIGGIIVGLTGGCALQVTGPAAGLVAVVVTIVHTYGLVGLAISTMIAGVFQILFGIMRVGPYFKNIPRSVVLGLLAGIGGLIILSQVLTLADIKPSGSPFNNLKLILQLDQGNQTALFLGVITLLFIITVEFLNKKFKKQIPAVLVSVLAATILSFVFKLDILYLSLPDKFFTTLSNNFLINNKIFFDFPLVLHGLLIALIATTESLLSVNAVDQVAQTKSNYNKETLAQGIGNLFSGFFGALPLTGVIVRSSANVNAGGKTRLSTIMHGMWILLFVSFFSNLLGYLPLTALAAILVHTGFKLLNLLALVRSFRQAPKDGIILITTMLSIIFIDLLNGVIIGLILYGILEFGRLKQRWTRS